MKIIVDGQFTISDETGQKVEAKKGDVFYFPKGSKITFTTENFGLGFFVGQRAVSAFSFPAKSSPTNPIIILTTPHQPNPPKLIKHNLLILFTEGRRVNASW